MRLSARFTTAYPKLSRWIDEHLPTVRSKPRVWKAFLKYSELSESRATWALTPGYNPDVDFKVIDRGNGAFTGDAFPNRIYLSKSICDHFESLDFASVKMHRLIESTLLHELVHWGDWKDGKDQVGEEGRSFEIAAYGKDIDRYW